MSSLASYTGLFAANFSNLLVIFTVCTQQLASFLVFECPCDRSYSQIYGLSYLLGPGIVLLIEVYYVLCDLPLKLCFMWKFTYFISEIRYLSKAVLLFIVALSKQPVFWRLITGCLNRQKLFRDEPVNF